MSKKHPLIKRTNKARNFPSNTCGASRHAQQIAEALIRGDRYPALTDEAAHCGESILAAVAALWETRTALARLVDVCRRMDAEVHSGGVSEAEYRAALAITACAQSTEPRHR